ncbi:M10 family metallopeptidase C-terminal domain-containing protein [Ruegeria atlantica]|uniref:M10 family metallopeptidase C-terminal domain-containing protein n=1 Tax=Ruegeria atlantica TaxID=81569 RepID=UPI002494EE91|nr:M10 family metallopeptidase C-terminal domain-containing protein [Ruegeria atlantica]
MTGVTSPFGSYGAGNLNQGVYTVMSYNDGWTQQNGLLSTSATFGGSTGLGALDIAALQDMYGANTSTNSGDNVYILSAANVAGVGYQAIWDTGGIDIIAHNGHQGATIDLRAATLDYSNTGGGVISHAAGVKGGFTIAHGVVIENAAGGWGDDTIHGNSAVNDLRGHNGHDTIFSASNGYNNNTIHGGNGNDVIHLANGRGADTVFGENDDDIALVSSNAGSFFGGAGHDTVRFASALSNFLFLNNGGNYEFLNLITRLTFTVGTDVELFQFQNGVWTYDLADLTPAVAVQDIETNGTVLQYAVQGAYILDGGTLNIGLKFGGQLVGNQTFAGWQAIQAHSANGGYRVLWKSADGQYTDWTIDGQGNFLSNAGVANVVDLETVFNADLNNDGTIGHTINTVETDGSTNLREATQGYYVIGTDTRIKFNGQDVGPNSFAGWKAIHVEADGGDYRVLWTNGNGEYTDWTLNGSGSYVSHTTVDNIVDVETVFDVDFNNDGTIGHTTKTIESNGSTTLSASTHGYYLIGADKKIEFQDEYVGPNSFAGWEAVQVEAKDGGYRVLWKNEAGEYTDWTLNGDGEYQSHTSVQTIEDAEILFGVDLNDNGTTGYETTTVETNGSTSLAIARQGFYLIDGATRIKFNGQDMSPSSFEGWTAIHVEATAGGYRVLWTDGDRNYTEWTLDGDGNYVSHAVVDEVINVESFYGYDIDGSGTVGFEEPRLAQQPGNIQDAVIPESRQASFSANDSGDDFHFQPETMLRLAATGASEDDEYGLQTNVSVSEVSRMNVESGSDNNHNVSAELLLESLLEDDSFWL